MAVCLHCQSTGLETLSSSAEITFYRCPSCQRDFAQKPGKSLTERWPGLLGLVLYGVIFSPHPQDRAAHIAAMLQAQKSPDLLRLIANEIRSELAHPTQQVRDILDLPASEEDLRDFLRMVADILEERL